MERLTEWRGEHAAVVNHHANYIDRLAAYEDTGMEPQDFLATFTEEACLKLTAQYLKTTPDRLRQLVQAEREGRQVALEGGGHE